MNNTLYTLGYVIPLQKTTFCCWAVECLENNAFGRIPTTSFSQACFIVNNFSLQREEYHQKEPGIEIPGSFW